MSSAVANIDLPKGWAAIPLGDVIKLEYGKALTKKARDESGEVPVYGSSGDVGRHNEAYINEPCLIVGRKGNVGNIFISQQPCWPIDTVYYVIPPKGIDIKYLYYQLGQLNLARLDKSTAIPGLNRNDAYKVPFKLAPPEQQKHIVAKIEELFSHIDAGIEALKKAKQLLKQYRQSVLKAAVTGELTKEWRDAQGRASVAGGRTPGATKLEPATQLLERILKERRQKWEEQQLEQFKAKGKVPKDDKWKEKYKDPEDPIIHDLPEIAEEWLYVRLDAVADIQGGLTVDSKRKKETTKRLPYLRVANVQRGYLDLSEIKEIDVPEDRVKGLLLEDRDILFNEGGDRDKLGRGWVWHNEIEPCTYQNHVFRARPYSEELVSEFISIFGNTYGQEYFIKQGKQTTNLASINKTKLSAFPVPVCTYDEMKTAISKLEEKMVVIDRTEKSTDAQLIRANQKKQSILAAAFSGNLVENIDSGESAEELLGRIAKEKALAAGKEKLGKRRATKKKVGKMAKRSILEVLKEADSPLDVDELFEKAGYASDLTSENVEQFYSELKKVVELSNVEVTQEMKSGKKQGDIFFYKA